MEEKMSIGVLLTFSGASLFYLLEKTFESVIICSVPLVVGVVLLLSHYNVIEEEL